MICPVSLGRDLGDDPENANIVPVNVHLPVVFAVYSQLRSYGLQLKGDRDLQNAEIDTVKQKNPLLQLFKASLLRSQTEKLAITNTEIATVEENMKLLSQELQ